MIIIITHFLNIINNNNKYNSILFIIYNIKLILNNE